MVSNFVLNNEEIKEENKYLNKISNFSILFIQKKKQNIIFFNDVGCNVAPAQYISHLYIII